jgi:hypothetical protein
MTSKVHHQCAVCAWRETCSKKHTIQESALRCPDFTRDERLPAEAAPAAPVDKHKHTEDVFGDG